MNHCTQFLRREKSDPVAAQAEAVVFFCSVLRNWSRASSKTLALAIQTFAPRTRS